MRNFQNMVTKTRKRRQGNSAAVLTEPAFLDASLATAHAMLDRDVNHPSIILCVAVWLLESTTASAWCRLSMITPVVLLP